MTRTTLDIDAHVLRQLKERREHEGKTLGAIASELLASALATTEAPPEPFVWESAPMALRVDLEDKDAVERALADD